MIEFKGRITGDAEKYLWNKSRQATRIAMCLAALFVSLVIIIGAIVEKNWLLLGACGVELLAIYLLTFIPVGKKQRENFTPNKIFTDEEYIVCCANKYEEYRLIADASKLIDYGSFYYISFPFGKKSDNFICQKNLLTKGTIEEFEALFEGKIERRI